MGHCHLEIKPCLKLTENGCEVEVQFTFAGCVVLGTLMFYSNVCMRVYVPRGESDTTLIISLDMVLFPSVLLVIIFSPVPTVLVELIDDLHVSSGC
jgi:hypothetical protein